MGTRYHLTVDCPYCNWINYDVYYAPTCGITTFTCESCGKTVDIFEAYPDAPSYEEASNANVIQDAVDALMS